MNPEHTAGDASTYEDDKGEEKVRVPQELVAPRAHLPATWRRT